jgi:pyridoxamine 5'-phosphate oxidase
MSQTEQPPLNGDLHAEREDYNKHQLNRADLSSNPLDMFAGWLQQARDLPVIDATAMTLATCNAQGLPSARIVLLKQYDEDGFCWYTNYESRKGGELADNPHAALLFYWRELERQVRIEGAVEKVAASQSTDYFKSRPDGSRYSAAASPQSQVVPDQKWLAQRTEELQREYPGDALQRPDFWGGYRLQPVAFEFWQGRPSRLHDRFKYTRASSQSDWKIERLAP